jgi:phage FluMu gp28-like protein
MSETVILEALLLALGTPYHDVYLCSTSYDNAKELLRRLTIWFKAFSESGVQLPIVASTKTQVEFVNGSRIIPKPAMSVRSRTGTVVLDELAFYQHDYEVWRGVAPVADTSDDLRIIVISTPFGASGLFWELWLDPEGEHGDWSRHRIDVYDAAEQGFPVDPAQLETKYPSDIWRQEFCCEFLSDINQYFSHELIRRSQYSDRPVPEGVRFAGIDLASSRDASCMASAVDDSDGTFWLDRVHQLKAAGESRDYEPQFADVVQLLDADSYRRVAVDATGEGAQLGQNLRRRYGAGTITEVRSGDWRDVRERISDIRLAMERGEFRIPNDPRTRNAFTKIQKNVTTNNRTVYEATRDADGHADEFFAALLAWHARELPAPRRRVNRVRVGYQR